MTLTRCPSCGSAIPELARFCPSCGIALALVEPEPDETTPAPASDDELRPVTALFADIVGSTGLGERLGPDEVKALIGECVSRMSRAVEEYGGIIQAYMGDGICAYFGVPVAHEDDPERAARAALRILDVVGEYSRDIALAWGIPDFNVRVGINTGQTAVGLVGAAERQAVALGDTTNVAARLQSAAAPGTIAVGEATARRLAHRFGLKPVGEVAVKGREASVTVWRLIRWHGENEPAPTTRLVGREAETARLHAVVDELAAGRGSVVLVEGEAGIGKTRLLAELETLLAGRATFLEGHCLSYGGIASAPFVEMLREWLGVEEGDAEIAVRTKARAKLGAVLGGDLLEVLPALGRLLRIRLDPEREERTPADARGDATGAYVAWIRALAELQPVVVALEDLHWADRSTRELAEALLELTDLCPVMVVATFRADPATEGWRLRVKVLADYDHRAAELELGPLSEAASRELVEELMPAGVDPRSVDEIVRRAEGNPLFIEELLQMLVEGGTLEPRRQWTVSLVAASQLSPALQTLLVARIDLLPPGARRLAQMAAVIGRAFPLRVLERVAGQEDLGPDLTLLLRGGIVRELRRYPESEYTFRHGMFQEAALSTLTRPRRQELHARVAAAFEELFADMLDDHLERLAHHHAQSENVPQALAYLDQAAERELSLDAASRAGDLWRRALRLAARAGDAAAEERISARLAEVSAPTG